MITIPRKTECIIPVSISQILGDGDTAVFLLKNGNNILLNKEIIQNEEEHIIHLYISDTADIAVGYYQYSIVVTKSDETSFSFDGKAYIKEGGLSGAFIRGGDTLIGSTGGRSEGEFVHADTVSGWNNQPLLIGKAGHIYIYTDYTTVDESGSEVVVPNIKIGDGKAYLIDNPFISLPLEEVLRLHSTDMTKHITDCERNLWNDKVRCYIDENDAENIIFTTDRKEE